jgi:hypothetical protein
MKRVLFFIVGLIASVFLLQTPSYAAWMQGKIKNVDNNSRMITIDSADAQKAGASSSEIQVKVLENAKFKNISSLNDLKSGQEVKVDARNNKEQGFWDANYIEVLAKDQAGFGKAGAPDQATGASQTQSSGAGSASDQSQPSRSSY